MAYSNIAILVGFILVALLYASNGAIVTNSCPLPSKLKSNYDYRWKSKTNEWSNTTAKTNSFKLVLSWTPTFCASLPQNVREKEFQCLSSNKFGFIVHGLWPQAARATSVRAHPRNCRDEKQLNATFVKQYFCIMPDEDLIQAQWEKHGTCHYGTATDYYKTTENLFKFLRLPDIRAMKNPTATSIKNAFLSINTQVYASAIQVSMDEQNRLEEVKVCYNLQYQFTSCYT